ncbi:hypothetical protein PV773_24500 [Mesorhizobium sp. CC13]|uniref:slr1659 superfamily regulator n=1 Tax=Mesorhizobium sp. CC13 TaxID=3029194 RepID=UPI003266974C
MKIVTNGYQFWTSGNEIYFTGVMRPENFASDQPIMALLRDILNSRPPAVTLNIRGLNFVNSQGKNLLARLVIEVRKHPEVRLHIKGDARVPWQPKSLSNLQKLHPGLMLAM